MIPYRLIHVRYSGTICQLTEDCMFWSWDDVTGDTPAERCLLKNSDSGLMQREGYFSGTKDCP